MTVRVAGLALAQLAVAVALVVAAMSAAVPTGATITLGLVVLALTFALAEAASADLPVGDHVITLSVSELVTAVALVTAAPVTIVAARVLGGIPEQLRRQNTPVRVAFNLSLFAFDAAIAVAVFRLLSANLSDLTSPAAWAVAIGAVYAGQLGGLAGLTAVVAATGGRSRVRESVPSVGLVSPFMLATATIGTIGAQLVLRDERTLGLIAVLGLLWFILLRAVGLMARRYGTLQAFHVHTAALQASTTASEAAAAATTAIHALLGAEHAELHTDTHPTPRATVRSGVGGWVETPVERPIGDPSAISADELRTRGLRSAVAVPLLGGADTPAGYVLAGWRRRTRGHREITRTLRTIAHQTAATMQRLSVTAELSEELEEKHRRSLHDPLTELPNRAHLLGLLDEALGTRRVGVLLIELQGFRAVNETLGYASGDAVVMAAGARIRRVVRGEDEVARLEGQRFVVLGTDVDEERLSELADRVHEVLDRPFGHSGFRLDLSARTGLAWVDAGTSVDGTTMLRRAETALNRAAELGLDVEWHREGDDEDTLRRLRLAADLRPSIRRGEIRAHFQPKLDATTGRVVGVETLARWEHPDHGHVPPNQFVPLAERTGAIEDLTASMLDQSIAMVGAWRARGFDLTVAVNIPPAQLESRALEGTILRLLDEHAIPASALLLELTESATVESPASLETLDRLRTAGIALSIDDFGTGYSSLHYLHRLAATELKIDRSFVSSLDTASSDLIVRSTIELAHGLGMSVVAEGVEDVTTMQLLAAMGCDVIQGWVAAPALDVSAFEAFLLGLEDGCWRAPGAAPVSRRSTR